MGVDLFTITGHKFNYQQIIQLQSKIESDEVLRRLYWLSEHKSIPWETIASEDRLAECWKHNKEQIEIDGVFFHDLLYFPTFFGDIRFHPNIIQLTGFGLKLWTMESDSQLRRNILFFYERVAKLIGQDTIIYFGDSWAKSSWIQDAVYVKSIDEILMQIKFKKSDVPEDIDKTIKNDHIYVQLL